MWGRDLPDFARYCDEFEEVLTTTFGEPDPVASASYKLDSLIMKYNHHINKYNVDFQELATITGYDNRALHAMYYHGLAPHIKDTLAISGESDTHIALKTKAQAMDLGYWNAAKRNASSPAHRPVPPQNQQPLRRP